MSLPGEGSKRRSMVLHGENLEHVVRSGKPG